MTGIPQRFVIISDPSWNYSGIHSLYTLHSHPEWAQNTKPPVTVKEIVDGGFRIYGEKGLENAYLHLDQKQEFLNALVSYRTMSLKAAEPFIFLELNNCDKLNSDHGV